MITSCMEKTVLLDGILQERRNRNMEYMLSLQTDNLLLSHRIEAGLRISQREFMEDGILLYHRFEELL